MVSIEPFQALRPVPSLAARVASLPYDVVSREEAADLARGNPLSFLHVVRSEIDLPGTDPYDPSVYQRARDNLESLRAGGVMQRDPEARLYLYRQVRQGVVQVGVVGTFSVAEYQSGAVRRHERTRADKEDDRTRHILAIEAQAGPVFLACRDDGRLVALQRHDMNARPLYHFDAVDGITHTVWPVPDPEPYRRLVAAMPRVYIADGHHRAASAARAAARCRESAPEGRGAGRWDRFLGALFPAGQLRILAYNRFVSDLGPLDGPAFLARLAGAGTVTPCRRPVPPGPGSWCVYVQGRWHLMTLDPASIDHRDPVGSLDVALLQDRVLAPVLGITDPRTDHRLEFVGGIHGTAGLEQRVDAAPGSAAFSLHPTSMDQLLAVADAGLIMPPKSTWFEPKLRSGLLVHEIGTAC